MINYLAKRKKLTQAIPYIFVAIGLLFVYTAFTSVVTQGQRNYEATLRSQTYTRATNCFVAVPAAKRTAEYIKSCYEQAEKATGKVIDHYGDGNQ